MNVVFICSGNTCRSPLAAAMYAARNPGISVKSCGLYAAEGAPASREMQRVAEELGLDLSVHRSRCFVREQVSEGTQVVCLSWGHLRGLCPQIPAEQLHLLGGGIPDPYGGGLEAYRVCAAEIERALPALDLALRARNIIQIGQGRLADLPEIAALERAVFSQPTSQARLGERLEQPHCVCSVARGTETGVLCGYVFVDEIAGEAYVDSLAVCPDLQRQGIGSRLLAALEVGAVVRGCSQIHIEARAGNAAALGLYHVRGYEIVGQRPRYYRDPEEDAILMTLRIQ